MTTATVKDAGMATFANYTTEQAAIVAARKLAIEAANDNACDWTEVALLNNGDTLEITATADGQTRERVTAGWTTDGLLHCGPRASSR